MNTCETCKLPVYDWGQEASPQGGSCKDCCIGICARPDCAAEPVEICCEECACEGLCWECASLRWCPEFPDAMIMEARMVSGLLPAVFDRPERIVKALAS